MRIPKEPKTLKSDLKSLSRFKTKIAAVVNQLQLPISLYAATERDRFRKPRTGMWEELREYFDLDAGEGVDLDGSLFVGDAGGRLADVNSRSGADFACSDR